MDKDNPDLVAGMLDSNWNSQYELLLTRVGRLRQHRRRLCELEVGKNGNREFVSIADVFCSRIAVFHQCDSWLYKYIT